MGEAWAGRTWTWTSFLIAGFLLVASAPARAATPTMVQHAAGPNTESQITGRIYNVPLPNPSTAGNFLMLVVFTGGGNNPAVTGVQDNLGTNWQLATSFIGANDDVFVFYRQNTAAGVKRVGITVNSFINSLRWTLSEWYNVEGVANPIRQADHNEASTGSTTWTSASGTWGGTVSGNLIYAIYSGSPNYQSDTVFTPGTGYALEIADLRQALVAQSRLADGGVDTPQLTAGKSATYIAAAVEIKASVAPQGSDNVNSFRIKRMQGQQYNVTGLPLQYRYQFPTDGNLQVLMNSNVQGNANIVSVTSSSSPYVNTQHSPTVMLPNRAEHMYSANATPSRSNTGIVTFNSQPTTGKYIVWLDIIGASTSPYDVDAGTGGTQDTLGGNITTHTITPTSGAVELMVDYVDHTAGSTTGVVDPSLNFMTSVAPGQDGDAGSTSTMDSGAAWKLSSTAVQFTYTSSAAAPGTWASVGAAYKAAAPGSAPAAPNNLQIH